MILSKAQILEAKDIETREVDVPEWGGSVLVRALSIKEANEWRKSMLVATATVDTKTRAAGIEYVFSPEAAETANVKMLAIAIVDESGARIFEADDVAELSGKSVTPINRLVEIVMEISGLSKKAANDAEKN